MSLSDEALWRDAVIEANRLGHEGKRVVGIERLIARDATEQDTIVFVTDGGPTSATESW